MENEIDKWLRETEHSTSAQVQLARKYLQQLKGECEGWQRQAGINLRLHQDDVCQLIRLGLLGDPRNVELYARRMRRQFPAMADAITPLLPPANPLRSEPTTEERR